MAGDFVSGTPSYLEIASSFGLTALPVTMMSWFVPDSSLSNTSHLVCLGGAAATNVQLALRSGTNGGNLVRASSTSSAINTDVAASATSWGATGMRRPHHAAAVFATTTRRVAYLDGIPGADNTASNAPNFANFSVCNVGIQTFNGSRSLGNDGRQWGAAMWRAALTPEEIRAVYFGVSPLKIRRASLLFYLPLETDFRDYANGNVFTPSAVGLWKTPAFPSQRPVVVADASGPAAFSLTAEPAAFTLTLNDVGLRATHRMSAEPAAFTLTLNPVTFRTGFSMRAEPAHYTLTINAVDFLSTQPYLPRASAGLNYTFFVRESFRAKARGSDTIYDGATIGTELSSSQRGSMLKLIATDAGKWFVLSKTGTWSLA
jgi:hypothetical protein